MNLGLAEEESSVLQQFVLGLFVSFFSCPGTGMKAQLDLLTFLKPKWGFEDFYALFPH